MGRFQIYFRGDSSKLAHKWNVWSEGKDGPSTNPRHLGCASGLDSGSLHRLHTQ